MTIRKRLTLAFLAVLVLFSATLVVYFFGDAQRENSMRALRQAIDRQTFLASIVQDLHDTQRQVTLLGQIATEASPAPVAADEMVRFDARVDGIMSQIERLRKMTQSGAFDELCRTFGQLSTSWKNFYRDYGVRHTKAITELAVRAEPLAHDLTERILPRHQAAEKDSVEKASQNFYATARVTRRVTVAIFLISIVVAVVVAWILSKRLTVGFSRLNTGAAAIGSGDLNHRIELGSEDELDQLAAAMNEMAGRLSAARGQLTAAHALEQQKTAELNAALDRLKKAQDQLITQERLASLGSLTAGIAHEIKNPLNFVTNFSDLSVELVAELKAELPGQTLAEVDEVITDLEANLRKIAEHGKRADSIVKGMLMHSRGQSGVRELTSINDLVAEYVKLAYHGMRAQNRDFNITIVETYDPAGPQIEIASQDLSRVILNIANNACYSAYHARDGGSRTPMLWVSTVALTGAVEIHIKDNGAGIPENARKHIFDPFYTTKPTGQGTGLGLSISYDIVVRQHNGELEVQSEEGEFAEFIIRLPA
jgi:signal transduction histidine kinase